MPGNALIIKKFYNDGSEEAFFKVKNKFDKIDDNRREIVFSGYFDSIESDKLTELNKFFI